MQYDIIGESNTRKESEKFFTVSDLIELCEVFSFRTFRFIGTAYTVGHLHSWRGAYCLPAISYQIGSRTGKEISKSLRDSLSDTHYGWKGGEYYYSQDSEFYVSQQGHSEEFKVCAFLMNSDGEIILLTKIDPY